MTTTDDNAARQELLQQRGVDLAGEIRAVACGATTTLECTRGTAAIV
jgi:hypothetical protein